MVSGDISGVVYTAEYRCCKLCRSKVEIQDMSLLIAQNAQL